MKYRLKKKKNCCQNMPILSKSKKKHRMKKDQNRNLAESSIQKENAGKSKLRDIPQEFKTSPVKRNHMCYMK